MTLIFCDLYVARLKLVKLRGSVIVFELAVGVQEDASRAGLQIAYLELDLAWNLPFIDHTTVISPTQASGRSGRIASG